MNPTELTVNVETGEVVQRELTAEEIAELENAKEIVPE